MGEPRRIDTLVVCLAFLSAPFLDDWSAWAQPPGSPAPPSDRIGQELRLAPSTEEGVGAILGGLLGGGREAAVRRVVLREESSTLLVVDVAVKGYGGKRLRGEIRDRSRHRVAWIDEVAAEIPAGEEATVSLRFSPHRIVADAATVDAAAAAQEFDSAYVTIGVDWTTAGSPAGAATPLRVSYRLDKHWRVEPLPDDVLVRAVARPEGAAASLPAAEPGVLTLPPQRIRILSDAVFHVSPAAVGTMTAQPIPGAQPLSGRRAAGRATDRVTPVAPGVLEAAPAAATPPASTLTAVDVRSARMVAATQFHFGLDRQTTDRGGRGPGAQTLDLLEGLRSDVEVPRERVTRVASRLFQDQNVASGVVYFLPESFALSWSVDNGYGLRMLYGASTDGSPGDVRMSATLQAGVDTSEIQLARELLLAYQRRHPQLQFTELRPLPITAVPAVSLGGTLSSTYDVPSERIVVNAISDALAAVDLAWTTDAVTKDNLELALTEDVGLNGTVSLAPAGGLTAQSLPLRIRLADERTFGALEWRRDSRWRNATPYPVRLKYLHLLLIDHDVPVIYSWNLDGAEVPPRAQVQVDATSVVPWLDRKALRSWIEYVPLADCTSCDREVMRAVTGGVTAVTASRITLHTITPLADTGAYEIAVEIRSRYFDARSREVVVKPAVVLDGDGKDFEVGPIYVPAGDDLEGPLFEYRMELTRPDGTTTSGSRWMPMTRLRLLVGRVQVEEALANP